MKYAYPMVITEDGGKFLASSPDLPGCHTFGDSLPEVIEMSRDALSMWLCIAENNGEQIPEPSANVHTESGLVSYVDVDTIEYRRQNDSRAVKKTLSVPAWLNARAERAGINFSAVLQDALKSRLNIV